MLQKMVQFREACMPRRTNKWNHSEKHNEPSFQEGKHVLKGEVGPSLLEGKHIQNREKLYRET